MKKIFHTNRELLRFNVAPAGSAEQPLETNAQAAVAAITDQR